MGYIKDIRRKVGHSAVFMPAAGCFVYEKGKILLQRRVDNGKWAASGGAMELGEEILETLKREVREELGIVPVEPKLVGFYAGKDRHFFYPNGDEVYVVMGIYLVDKYEGAISVDKDEVKETKWFGVEAFPSKEEINAPDCEPLIDAIKMMWSENGHKTHILHLDEEPFRLIEDGEKTIELRLNDEKRRKIKVNDLIEFINRKDRRKLLVRVVGRKDFRDFEELYDYLPLGKCGYGKADIAMASAKDMEKYYPLDMQRKYGVVGIEIRKVL